MASHIEISGNVYSQSLSPWSPPPPWWYKCRQTPQKLAKGSIFNNNKTVNLREWTHPACLTRFVSAATVRQLEENESSISKKHYAAAEPWQCQCWLAQVNLGVSIVQHSRRDQPHHSHQEQPRVQHCIFLSMQQRFSIYLYHVNLRIDKDDGAPFWKPARICHRWAPHQRTHSQEPAVCLTGLIQAEIAEPPVAFRSAAHELIWPARWHCQM
jgi:hypothetical protein